ncbi:MAG TPA: IPT/TIG domain-containing protein, partial [Vicinamibacteria bacterium]
MRLARPAVAVVVLSLLLTGVGFTDGPERTAAVQGGPLPGTLPLFPATNWWNLDITSAPVDPGSDGFITFLGPGRGLHPDFGACADSPCGDDIYGMPYIIVDGSQPKRQVNFTDRDGYPDESDGDGVPFYPIPDQAITQRHWIEGGAPGGQDVGGDRHMLLVDRDNLFLYELWDLNYDPIQGRWEAGSGAFFDMKTNNRRTDGWTSADAAGLAILPGLVRYDEAFGAQPIRHAIRFTSRDSNGYVYPASHEAGSRAGALPMGARLRLKPGVVITGFPAHIQRIFQAMKTYGLIMADNGSDMYISGTFDTRWDNDQLNPYFSQIHASDFEVIQLGWNPAAPPTLRAVSPPSGPLAGGTRITVTGTDFAAGATVSVGGSAATAVTRVDANTLTATTPAHAAGTVAVTVTNPGTLSATLAGAFTFNPLRYFALTPCRVFDTRQADGPVGGPALTPGSVRQFPVGGACGVPAGARAVAANFTAVNPAGV